MKQKTFTVTVNHDNGSCRIKVIARSKKKASQLIMKAENCPKNAIQSIETYN